jgi:hypothetical protein
MNPIDIQCYRPLKAGNEFAKLIPPYKGIDYGFDKKNDNSNTYDTLRFMAFWSKKYADQMSKVAPLLKGRNLQQTVNNIYSFLYNHFQYKIDGETQNLYSPSAAWHFREKGFDCKTYSILASTILQNLHIPHAFRMVKQGGLKPNDWSHVYVVVPNGNNHYVIDATTHSNNEVSYTQKYDYNMKHRGLASPFMKFNGLGCACQGKPLSQTGLSSPAVFSTTVQNFHKFLNELEKNGVSRPVTDKMLELVKANVQNGIDPNMGEILRKAFAEVPAIGMNSPAYSQKFYGSQFNGLGLNGGIDVGATATQLANGDYVGATFGIVKNIIPVEKTFGQVFANGFDLSCWNSSYSEQKAKKDIEKDMPYILEWSGIYKKANQDNFDRFMFITERYLQDAQHGQQSKYAKCTRKGHALREKAIKVLRENVISEFESQGFKVIAAGRKTLAKYEEISMPGYGYPVVFLSKNAPIDTEMYTIISSKPVEAPANVNVDASGNKTVTTTNPDGSKIVTTTDSKGNVTVNTIPAPKSSTGLIVGIGSAIFLAAKYLL